MAPSQSPDALAIEEGKGLLSLGQQDAALNSLRGFVVRFPESPYIHEAYILLGKILQQRGDNEQAVLYLSRVPENDRGTQGHLVEGMALVGLGKAEEGLNLLVGLDPSALNGEDQLRRLQAMAEADALLNRNLESLVLIHQAVV